MTQGTSVETSQVEVSDTVDALEAARRSHGPAVADLRQSEANAQNAAAEETRYRRRWRRKK